MPELADVFRIYGPEYLEEYGDNNASEPSSDHGGHSGMTH